MPPLKFNPSYAPGIFTSIDSRRIQYAWMRSLRGTHTYIQYLSDARYKANAFVCLLV